MLESKLMAINAMGHTFLTFHCTVSVINPIAAIFKLLLVFKRVVTYFYQVKEFYIYYDAPIFMLCNIISMICVVIIH